MPKLDGVDGNMLMLDLYESNYKIHNHLSPTIQRPLASVAFHPCEDFNEGSLLQNAIKTFIEAKVGDYTGLNLVDYLELPSDIARMILDSCQDASKRKGNDLEEIEKQFKNAGKG